MVDGSECKTQLDAVNLVRQELIQLNKIVLNELRSNGIRCENFSPHKWAKGTGVDFTGSLESFAKPLNGFVPVCHGDVVDIDSPQKFGILSGDDIIVRLCLEIPNVAALIFAVGDVDGLLYSPPSNDGMDNTIDAESNSYDNPNLIKVWSPSQTFTAIHHSEIDVTGGIGLKAARGAYVAERKKNEDLFRVLLLNGKNYKNLVSAMNGGEFVGTQIIPDTI